MASAAAPIAAIDLSVVDTRRRNGCAARRVFPKVCALRREIAATLRVHLMVTIRLRSIVHVVRRHIVPLLRFMGLIEAY